MNVSRIKQKQQIILDFSDRKISKTRIQKSLNQLTIKQRLSKGYQISFVNNTIKVGMYSIDLLFPPETLSGHLNDLGEFNIKIYDSDRIDLSLDKRFRQQYWAHDLSIKLFDLVNIIDYCSKLDKLKCFS